MYSYPHLIRKLDEECPPGQCWSRYLALIALIGTKFLLMLLIFQRVSIKGSRKKVLIYGNHKSGMGGGVIKWVLYNKE